MSPFTVVFSILDLKSAYYQIPLRPFNCLKQMGNCTNIHVYLSSLLMVCHVFKELWIT